MDRDKITNIDYGLEIIEGLMGSGKSFMAVWRILRAIFITRRPVYTNLPIKWKVFRKYLRIKGGEELANLIRPLDEKHWRAFLNRQHKYSLFREETHTLRPDELEPDQLRRLSAATGKTQQALCNQHRIFESQMKLWFDSEHGIGVEEGPHADHIPLGSIIVIDEVQHWHPMSKQARDPDGDQLLAYLTMCRHHLHWIWVITQDRTRINIQFRLFASFVWFVRNRGEHKLAWGIRFKHLGLRGMGYEKYTKDQLEAINKDDLKPLQSFTVMAHRKKNQVIFRLYNSFTQAGSERRIKGQIRKARKESGLDESGYTEKEKQQRIKDMKKEKSKLRKLIRKVRNAAILLVFFVIVFAIGLNWESEAIQEIVNNEKQPEQIKQPWPKYNGIIGTQPLFDGKPVQVGSVLSNGAILRHYNTDNRRLAIEYDGGYWLWSYGQQQPRPVGEVATVQAAYEQWQLHGERTPGEVFGAAAPNDNAGVGAGQSHDLGD